MFKFKYEKETKGEQVDGLDLITKLLTPHSAKSKTGVLIEELDDKKQEDEEDDNDEDGDIWYVEQMASSNSNEAAANTELNDLEIKYGFAQTKSKTFSKLSVNIKII